MVPARNVESITLGVTAMAKTYDDVISMLKDVSDDEEFIEEVSKLLAEKHKQAFLDMLKIRYFLQEHFPEEMKCSDNLRDTILELLGRLRRWEA